MGPGNAYNDPYHVKPGTNSSIDTNELTDMDRKEDPQYANFSSADAGSISQRNENHYETPYDNNKNV
jgi:hypothetical protein